jgi:prolipoprotein diacylglyceryl transferase
VTLASIPSPPDGVWEIGPVPIRAYALCVILGIVAAILIGQRRWAARGGVASQVGDVAIWAVPFGIVGGRVYHVLTSPQQYFGEGGDPAEALMIWHGGLGIWGAIALGGVGAWVGCRRLGIPLPPFADALAPGIAVAQAIGRWGNWFNQELFGRPTTVPWALEIDPDHRPRGYGQFATFHPTFLYESLWCLLVAGLVVWADRRFRMGHGRAFALYVAAYCVGRLWIEGLRIDTANTVGGFRLNEITSVVVFIGAVLYIVVSARLRPGRETLEDGQLKTPDAEAQRAEAEGAETAGTETEGAETEEAQTEEAQTDNAQTDDAQSKGTESQDTGSGVP